jgi:hypothetical protein
MSPLGCCTALSTSNLTPLGAMDAGSISGAAGAGAAGLAPPDVGGAAGAGAGAAGAGAGAAGAGAGAAGAGAGGVNVTTVPTVLPSSYVIVFGPLGVWIVTVRIAITQPPYS